MTILVIGCGSIGRRHIRLLREMGVEVVAHDAVRSRQKEVAKEYDAIDWLAHPLANEWESFEWLNVYYRCDGIIVATPPDNHWASWHWVLRKFGVPMLIEKPLATRLDDAKEMVEESAAAKLPLLVGYNLRFHPGLRKVKELLDNGAVGSPLCASIYCGSYLPDWRPGTDYRSNYAARRDSGGGVLLDISHEIDMALWLFGEPAAVTCMAQTTGALEGLQTEDVADVLIRFKSGVQVNVHLDYVRRDRKRGCEIVGTEGTLVWDAASEFVYRCDGEPLNKYQWFVGPVDGDTMYRAQLRHFLAVIRGKETPVCTGEDGLLALRLALAARESAETGKVVTL